MNMQDYRHAADRVHIADHCKEEVLGMKTKTTDRKPVIRIVTGITAAAACLGITGAFGYALFNMKQDGAKLPAGTQLESEFEEQSEAPVEALSLTDDREFPLFRCMTEEQQIRTFDWGTIRLDGCGLSGSSLDEKRHMQVELHVHLNDDIEINEGDCVRLDLSHWMYDTEMQHKVSLYEDGRYADAKIIQSSDNPHELDYLIEFPAPIAGGCATCLTLGEDGEYHNIETDFLEKQPMPEYMLYELQLNGLSILTPCEDTMYDDNEAGSASAEYNGAVIYADEHTPLFKFRMEDLPSDDEVIVEVPMDDTVDEDLITAENTEYPPFDVLDTQWRTKEYEFGFVICDSIGYELDDAGNKLDVLSLTLIPHNDVREKIEQGAETYLRYTANGHIGDEYWFSMDQGMNFAKVYPTEDGNYGAVITFAPATRELYHILNENGEYVSECGDPNETVSWADMCIDLHFNELFVRDTPFEGENTQGILQRDVLSYDFANQSGTPLLKFRFPDPADCIEASESEPVYELFSALPEQQRIFTDKFGTFRLDEITYQDDLPILSYSIKLSDELQIPEKVAVYAYPVIIGHNGDWTRTIVADASVEEINEFTAGKPDADGWYHFRIALASASGEFRSGDLIDCRLFNVSYCAAYSSNAVELYLSDEVDDGKNGICFKLS